jgi:hypothetical protein
VAPVGVAVAAGVVKRRFRARAWAQLAVRSGRSSRDSGFVHRGNTSATGR